MAFQGQTLNLIFPGCLKKLNDVDDRSFYCRRFKTTFRPTAKSSTATSGPATTGIFWPGTNALKLFLCGSFTFKFDVTKYLHNLWSISWYYFRVNLLTLFCKLDHFINISNIYGLFMKRSSVQYRVSKFLLECFPTKFYEIDPRSILCLRI